MDPRDTHLTLITGGSRSGKSAHALRLAQARDARRSEYPPYFIATAEALDEEMTARIAHHRAVRPADFRTIEEPLALTETIGELRDKAGVVVLDCLTLWVANLMGAHLSDRAITAQAEELAHVLSGAPFPAIVVTDEVGSGLVPMDPVGRRFRDLLGWTNQKVALAADEVLLMVAGYPLTVK
jgi:adenosylcobinamide kinase/adenosylcobinamide-phosphate guanylyltransferase